MKCIFILNFELPRLKSLHEKKEEIRDKMIKAVENWDESAERNINYRSLKELLITFMPV